MASATTTTKQLSLMRQRGTRRSCTAAIVLGVYPKRRLPGGKLFQHYCQRLQAAFPRCKYQRTGKFARTFAYLCYTMETHSRIFDEYPRAHGKLIPMLLSLAQREGEWIRPLGSWKPDPEATGKEQYSSLLEHLFIKYPPPNFFKSVLQTRDGHASQEHAWYLHLGSGQSLRTAPGMRVVLSKREAHNVLRAPTHLSIYEALLWGKLETLGAEPVLIAEIMRTGYAYSFVGESRSDFRNRPVEIRPQIAALTRMFVRSPNADPNQIGPLIDFLDRTGDQAIRQYGPDLKNQTITSLTRGMEEWHEGLYRMRAARREASVECAAWSPDRGIRPLYLPAGSDEPFCLWQLIELCCQEALSWEGRAMRHCVASYASRCASGSTSIWSLRTVSPEGCHSVATIEVQRVNRSRSIVQARAVANARPDEPAMQMIKRWAERNSISIPMSM